jgi:hypothetical protein
VSRSGPLSFGSMSIVGLVSLAAIIGIAYGFWFGMRAVGPHTLSSSSCRPVKAEDLSVEELVSLKRRWRRYTRSDLADGYFEISPREAAFLLTGEGLASVSLRAEGEQLTAEMAIPTDGGCYNVDFVGLMSVDAGIVAMEPSKLVIGGTDLADLGRLGEVLGATKRVIRADELRDPVLSARLANVASMRVADGRVQLRFIDPDLVWR